MYLLGYSHFSYQFFDVRLEPAWGRAGQLQPRQPFLTWSRPTRWHHRPGARPTLKLSFKHLHYLGETLMPIFAWLLGVPLSVILILMLLGVF